MLVPYKIDGDDNFDILAKGIWEHIGQSIGGL